MKPVSYTHLDVYKRQTCILAEVVRVVTKYNSFKGNSIAYVIFSLGMVGSPLPIWLFKADLYFLGAKPLFQDTLRLNRIFITLQVLLPFLPATP